MREDQIEEKIKVQFEEAETKKKDRRGSHMQKYWDRKHEQEQRFNVYRIPTEARGFARGILDKHNEIVI